MPREKKKRGLEYFAPSRELMLGAAAEEVGRLLDGKILGPSSALNLKGRFQTILVTCDVVRPGFFNLRITCSPVTGVRVDYSDVAVYAASCETRRTMSIERLNRWGYATIEDIPTSECKLRSGRLDMLVCKVNPETQPWPRAEGLPSNAFAVDRFAEQEIPATHLRDRLDVGSIFHEPVQKLQGSKAKYAGDARIEDNLTDFADRVLTMEVALPPRIADEGISRDLTDR